MVTKTKDQIDIMIDETVFLNDRGLIRAEQHNTLLKALNAASNNLESVGENPDPGELLVSVGGGNNTSTTRWLDQGTPGEVLTQIMPGLVDWASISGTGLGDVTGPTTSTDNAVALFLGTSGRLIKETDYIFPETDGVNKQVLSTDGVGKVTWKDPVGAKWSTVTLAPLNDGDQITVASDSPLQKILVVGSGAITLNSTPFIGSPDEGTLIHLIGLSDMNTVKMLYGDSFSGDAAINGNIKLERYTIIQLQWDSSFQRWIEVSRSGN